MNDRYNHRPNHYDFFRCENLSSDIYVTLRDSGWCTEHQLISVKAEVSRIALLHDDVYKIVDNPTK